jgi:hypothetical protein
MDDGSKLALHIEFERVDAAEAGRLAESLREYVLDADASVEATRRRQDHSSMDFGASLALLLSAPAIVAVAKGIGSFLERYQTARIRITRPDGSIVVENLSSRQAAQLAARLREAWPGANK